MKPTAFRIKNFRSIKDTGWHNLASDNITCLIGQNESGKTSVLVGLKAFHDGILIEDMLRSDLSLPEVTCKFKFEFSEFKDKIDMTRVHPDVKQKLETLDYLTLRREWESDLSTFLTTGEELNEIFKAEADERKQRELKIEKLIAKISLEYKKASLALEKSRKESDSVNSAFAEKQELLNEGKKTSRALFSKNKKEAENADINQISDELSKIKTERSTVHRVLKEKEKKLEGLKEKQSLKERLSSAQSEVKRCKNELQEARENFNQLNKIIGLYATEKEIRAAEATEEQYLLEIELAKDELDESRKQYDIMLLSTEKVFGGSTLESALKKSKDEISRHSDFMGPQELGEEIFKFTPEFEMFEDFSSLLPNRIDLEDVVIGNTSAEGYKAAVNFLTVTGLEYSFFQQPSTRILKQKIENLNGELTLNFQDFWRQNVGKNNKIKINFELAHYDHSHAENSGKPFIEFWIKDESERLYPKQRSRGVRWFLSFFLELKATAIDKNRRNKFLLIDEPGVSLHARAQEDVLKVFDDIREHMQIIYSTHSPHLIDVNKLYRVIAVQRAVEDDMNSETVVLDARSLKTATADTLSPVYAMMGARLSQQDIIKSFNNVIVKDLATFYFMKAILLLTTYDEKECFFIPASGTSSMPMIINILIGWGLEYISLNFGNDEEKFMYNKLRKELFDNNVDMADKQLLFQGDFNDVEDMFSTIDFKKYIVHVREGITVDNSDYLKDNNHSRAVLASNFLQRVTRGDVRLNDLDEETCDNIKVLINQLSKLLK